MRQTGKILFSALLLFSYSCVPAAREYVFDLPSFIEHEEREFAEKNNFLPEQLLDYRNWENLGYFGADNVKKLELQLKQYQWSLLETNLLYHNPQKQILSFSRNYFLPETESYFYTAETVDGVTFLHLYTDEPRARYMKSVEAVFGLNRVKITDGKNRYYYRLYREKNNEN